MTKTELIEKWNKEIGLYKRVLDNPLFYTIEQRTKASAKLIVLNAILIDIKELDSLK